MLNEFDFSYFGKITRLPPHQYSRHSHYGNRNTNRHALDHAFGSDASIITQASIQRKHLQTLSRTVAGTGYPIAYRAEQTLEQGLSLEAG
ncbi:hypothetical protein OAG76_05370 [Rubripirellula sp.]|nr:hypothetical protein [Rubripirellula sp.]